MAGRIKFSFSKVALAPTAGAIRNINEETFKDGGFRFAESEQPPAYTFSPMGGWSVSLRSSIIRITLFKLFGTGVCAFLLSTSPNVGKYTAFSCSMAAAVNFVAVCHYFYLWKLRQQVFNGPKYDRWMARVGRVSSTEEKKLLEEDEHDKRAIYFQEVEADGFRHSDWLCTLVLMTLDLGHLREYLYIASKGVVPQMPIAKEWLASFQALVIFFGSVYRFYFNEVRSTRDGEGGYKPASLFTFIGGYGSYVIACGFFGVICWGLLDGLPAVNKLTVDSLRSDVICLQLLVLVWIGYPVLSIFSRVAHMGVPGDEYSATISFVKDIGYAVLDVTSKAGLAIVFILKAAWVDRAEENALIAAGELALNITR